MTSTMFKVFILIFLIAGCGDSIRHNYEAPSDTQNEDGLPQGMRDCRYQKFECARGYVCTLANTSFVCMRSSSESRSESLPNGNSSADKSGDMAKGHSDLTGKDEPHSSSDDGEFMGTSDDLNDSGSEHDNSNDNASTETVDSKLGDGDGAQSPLAEDSNRGDGSGAESPVSEDPTQPEADSNAGTGGSQNPPKPPPNPADDPGPATSTDTNNQYQIVIGEPLAHFGYDYGFDEYGDELTRFTVHDFQHNDDRWAGYDYLIIMLATETCPACNHWLGHIEEEGLLLLQEGIMFSVVMLSDPQHEPASSLDSHRHVTRYIERASVIRFGEANSMVPATWDQRLAPDRLEAVPMFLVIRRFDQRVLAKRHLVSLADAIEIIHGAM